MSRRTLDLRINPNPRAPIKSPIREHLSSHHPPNSTPDDVRVLPLFWVVYDFLLMMRDGMEGDFSRRKDVKEENGNWYRYRSDNRIWRRLNTVSMECQLEQREPQFKDNNWGNAVKLMLSGEDWNVKGFGIRLEKWPLSSRILWSLESNNFVKDY